MTVTAAPESTNRLATAPFTIALIVADIPECSLILIILLGTESGWADP